jgi:hypothetical protein
LVLVLGCSDLTEGAGGVVELEIRVPAVTSVEVGEVVQLSARALDQDGNPVDVPISWRADAFLTVDETGLVTGAAPGTGQVQAFVGSLSSTRVPLTVIARADTLVLVGDSVVTVAADALMSAPLVVQLLSFADATPLPSRPVIYTVSFAPTAPVGSSVTLPGGVLVDTISTGTTGLDESMTLNRVAGVAPPDSAFVTVRSYRASGADVPGSGQRFIVLFQ